jgi:GxxExxY protein
MSLITSPLVEQVIGCAIQVHRTLGPGLFEPVYQQCTVFELRRAGLYVAQQVPIQLVYRGVQLGSAYRADLIVEKELLVEIKSVERIMPIHEMQILTYLRLSGLKQGLLINFNQRRLVDGVKSFLAPRGREDDEGSEEMQV